MPTTAAVAPYPIDPADPLADAHTTVSAWVEVVSWVVDGRYYYQEIDLKSEATGRTLLASDPPTARRLVLAALEQVRYWDDRHRARRHQAMAVVNALLRRKVPFDRADCLRLVAACNARGGAALADTPAKLVVRTLERALAVEPADAGSATVLKQFASLLKKHHNKGIRQLSLRVEHLAIPIAASTAEADAAGPAPTRPDPRPAPAGDPRVLRPLKRFLGMDADAGQPSATIVGPDRFPLADDSPLRREHEWLSTLLERIATTREAVPPEPEEGAAGPGRDGEDPAWPGRVALALAERHLHLVGSSAEGTNSGAFRRLRHAASRAYGRVRDSGDLLDRAGFFDFLLYLTAIPPHQIDGERRSLRWSPVDRAEAESGRAPINPGERFVLDRFRATLIHKDPFGSPSPGVERLSHLIGDGAYFFFKPCEAWAESINADLTAAENRPAWVTLLRHAALASGTRPTAKWLAEGRRLVAEVGGAGVAQALARWLPIVGRGMMGRKLEDANEDLLRGLVWLAPELPQPDELARALAAVAGAAFQKIPEVGPRAAKLGNSAIRTLAMLETPDVVGQLAILKGRIKFAPAQKEIEKAFAAAAAALGLPREEIEELGVPSYGLEEVGRRAEVVGVYRAELIVDGSDAELRWFDPKGEALKAVPAKVKAEHKDDFKEWQDALKDVRAMLPAQRDRIDALFLGRKSWPIADWRERYGDHPLVGTIARRLIWRIDGVAVIFADGTPTDLAGRPIEPGPGTEVATWHPVDASVEEVLAWRDRLETLGITQPFKQAHREVYLLTDAERRTATYSNRFAAHVIRQHQFNALCAARGWKNQLRLMVDNSYHPPSKELPAWGLRAEFWVEGIGDNYGSDTNEAGVYLRLATDQVRFYRTAADPHGPLPLDQIPPLVLSEVLRDVDLFVGVASVGNDPTWQDGGPGGRYQTYWQNYSFGELSGTAATRKEVLRRLVPRLKIAAKCSFSDRFLRVEGAFRAYKIHLGSGNILMEPNDQYLCIVADAKSRGDQGALFLPFEGDNLLSIILSKAFLLADDAKIQDPTILSQINRR